MAVTQGLSAIDDGIKSFDKLRKSIGFVGDIGAKSMGKLKKGTYWYRYRCVGCYCWFFNC